jgi:hypothetical protein
VEFCEWPLEKKTEAQMNGTASAMVA